MKQAGAECHSLEVSIRAALLVAYRAGQVQTKERALAVLRAGDAVWGERSTTDWEIVVENIAKEVAALPIEGSP
jgi:hypothetical protein